MIHSPRKLQDTADAFLHLHSRNVVHGYLKGVRGHFKRSFATILIPGQPKSPTDATDHAWITDFGLATVTQDLDSVRSALDDQGHAPRWAAPEVLNEQGTCSKGDVSFSATVVIEVRTNDLHAEFWLTPQHRYSLV